MLPQLVRKNSLARYADQSYKMRLALEFPPLMGALICTSAMQLACASGKSIRFALNTYTQTINGLRQALDQKIDYVSHDALLATVITLSVFESIGFFAPETSGKMAKLSASDGCV
ncbi:hypothetical protein N7454_009345 [Penicillium verhagenii]|nr:hypothetical protein N7454_009345 [Penicillium verhagenii]